MSRGLYICLHTRHTITLTHRHTTANDGIIRAVAWLWMTANGMHSTPRARHSTATTAHAPHRTHRPLSRHRTALSALQQNRTHTWREETRTAKRVVHQYVHSSLQTTIGSDHSRAPASATRPATVAGPSLIVLRSRRRHPMNPLHPSRTPIRPGRTSSSSRGPAGTPFRLSVPSYPCRRASWQRPRHRPSGPG